MTARNSRPAKNSIWTGKVPPSPPSRRSASLRTGVATAGWIALLAVCWVYASFKPIGGGDTWVGLANGRHVVTGGKIDADPYSFTAADRRWYNQNWLTGVCFYLLHESLGENSLVALKLAVIGATMGLMYLTARRSGATPALAASAVAAAAVLSRTYLDIRPHIFTLLATASFVFIAQHAYVRPRDRQRWRIHLIWFTVPIMAAWCNFHGGFIFGLIVIVAMAMGEPLRRALARRWGVFGEPGSIVETWPISAAAVACTITSAACSPLGVSNLTHAMKITRSSLWRQIAEWKPVTDFKERFGNTTGFWLLLAAVTLVALLMLLHWAMKRNRRHRGSLEPTALPLLRPEHWALMLLTLLMALKARRFIPLSLVVSVPILCGLGTVSLAAIRQSLKMPRKRPRKREHRTTRRHDEPATRRAAIVRAALGWAAAAVLGVLFGWDISCVYSRNHPFLPPDQNVFHRMIRSDTMPHETVKFLSRNDIHANVLTNWPWGGFVAFNAPTCKLFIDGRAQQLYTEQMFADYRLVNGIPTPPYSVNATDSQAQKVLQKYGVQLVVAPTVSGLMTRMMRLRGRWQLLYHDRRAAIFVRPDSSLGSKLLARSRTGGLWWPSTSVKDFSLGLQLSDSNDPAQLHEALEHLKHVQGTVLRTLADFATVKCYQQLGQLQQAINYMRKRAAEVDAWDLTPRLRAGLGRRLSAAIDIHRLLAALLLEANMQVEAARHKDRVMELSRNKEKLYELACW